MARAAQADFKTRLQVWLPKLVLSPSLALMLVFVYGFIDVSKTFYTQTLGLPVVCETYREARRSWKLDLKLGDGGQLEIFSFPEPPVRPTRPEACGLRHLAFRIDDLDSCLGELAKKGIEAEPVRIDENTGARFTFFADPDGLPIELYEVM